MPQDLFDVSQKIVWVSGGTRGIGLAVASGFAERGATVILSGRDAKAAQAAAARLGVKDRVVGIACDVSDTVAIEQTVEELIGRYGRIDTLVNVAGINRRMPAEQLTLDDYDYVMDVNLRGAFALSVTVGRHMLSRGEGNQINIGSLNNFRPVKWVAPYAISKAGIGQMTQALAMEWGARGVRVNCIAPGFIVTDLTRALWSKPVMRQWGEGNTPLRRLGQPDDMIGAAIFLASEASAFITGQILLIDGGFSAGIAWPIEQAMNGSAAEPPT